MIIIIFFFFLKKERAQIKWNMIEPTKCVYSFYRRPALLTVPVRVRATCI
jgi:hypothetical protein